LPAIQLFQKGQWVFGPGGIIAFGWGPGNWVLGKLFFIITLAWDFFQKGFVNSFSKG